jgi:hypothetical protein
VWLRDQRNSGHAFFRFRAEGSPSKTSDSKRLGLNLLDWRGGEEQGGESRLVAQGEEGRAKKSFRSKEEGKPSSGRDGEEKSG